MSLHMSGKLLEEKYWAKVKKRISKRMRFLEKLAATQDLLKKKTEQNIQKCFRSVVFL